MPTLQEYAHLSNHVYARTDENRTPIPTGWAEERPWIQDLANGFSAGVYKKGDEIVIAYTGTNERRIADFAFGNIPAYAGGDSYSAQVWEAMKLYLDVKRTNSATANITFTGHSLGGGLAAMMGIFFNREARVFDAAPFKQGAISSYALAAYQAKMVQFGYTNVEFDAYRSAVTSQYAAREGTVFGKYLQGEFITYLRSTSTAIGLNLPVETGPTTAGALDLHSMTLLASMERSTEFADAVRKLPNLITQIFDGGLYYYDPEVRFEPNFIDRLYIAQVSSAATPLLDRFGTDVKQLTVAGGTTAQQDMQKALDVAALDYYYYKDPANATGLFTTNSGAVNFNLADVGVAVSSLKSPEKLRDALALVAGDDGNAVKTAAGSIASWHVQSGAGGMNWAGSDDLADVAIGGTAGDTLNGGGGNDVLVGLGGADSLAGGAGNDTLVGGKGNDTLDGGDAGDIYVVAAYAGTDTIASSEAADRLTLDGRQLNGDGSMISDGPDLKLWMDLSNPASAITYRFEVPTKNLTVEHAGSVVAINDFVEGDVGIFIPKKPKNDPKINTKYRNGTAPPRPRDPLAIDLNGNGIDTVGITATPILFDHNADGIRTGTGWVQANDAWVVLDRDGSGSIDSGRELFGVDTLLSGTPGVDAVYASTGFAALAALNSNGDGVFNASDAAFNQVQLWQDLNQDGVSQAGELFTLAQKNIASIGLVPTASNVNLGNGNTVTGKAVVTRTSGANIEIDSVAVGTDSTAGNLNLANNPFYRQFTDSIPLTAAAKALPEMAGSGVVRDLREAMSFGNSASVALLSAVQTFAQGSTRDAQMASLDALLRTWAGTEAMATRFNIEPVGAETRRFVVTGSTDTALQAKLARIIPVLEVFNGITVDESGWAASTSTVDGKIVRTYTIAAQQATLMQASYDSLSNSVYSALVMQTRLKPYLDGIQSVTDEAGIRFDITSLGTALDTAKAANERNGILDLVELIRIAGGTLTAVGFDSMTKLNSWVSALPASSPIRTDLTGLDVFTGVSTTGTERNDVYIGTAGNDSFDGGLGDDVIDGGVGSDRVKGDEGNDSLYGGNGNDNLSGGFGVDYLRGQDGNDQMDGGGGNDILDGGAGNDTLRGNLGDDIYLFDIGSGADSIINGNGGWPGTNTDTILFGAGINPDGVTLKRLDHGVLSISVNGTLDALSVSGYFNNDGVSDYAIKNIKFNDGTNWDMATVKSKMLIGTVGNDSIYGYVSSDTINAGDGDDFVLGYGGGDFIDGGSGRDYLVGGNGNNTIRGGTGDDNIQTADGNDHLQGQDGNDSLSGGLGDDTLDGGAGSDTLYGASGADVYLFGTGSGQDTLLDEDIVSIGVFKDTVLLSSDIDPSKVTLNRSSDGQLLIRINGTTDTLRVLNYFNPTPGSSYEVENIRFADTSNTTWDLATIKAKLLTGTPGNDTLYGYSSADTINAGGGVDGVFGYAGDDVLDGGSGADKIDGGDGHDLVKGGDGDDLLYGQAGDDTLDGGSGNDYLLGGSGSNVYLFGIDSGQEKIQSNGGEALDADADTIQLGVGIATSDVTLVRQADNLIVSINGTLDTLLVYQYFRSSSSEPNAAAESIRFSDANHTIWSKDTVKTKSAGTVLTLTLSGTAGNDSMSGGLGDETLNGLDGNDTLDGGGGNDTLNGGLGADALIGGAGNDLFVVDNVGDMPVELAYNGVDSVDSTISWTLATEVENLRLMGSTAISAKGNASANALIGNLANNRLESGAGNDTLDGGAGDDTLNGGLGNDTYLFAKGSGHDHILPYLDTYQEVRYHTDTIQLGTGIATTEVSLYYSPSYGSSLTITILSTGESLEVDNYSVGDGSDEQPLYVIRFADNTVWDLPKVGTLVRNSGTAFVTGTAASDVLTGSGAGETFNAGAGNDVVYAGLGDDRLFGDTGDDDLYGDGGNDTLIGGLGNNTYRFGKGDGQDFLQGYDRNSSDASATKLNTLQFGANVLPSELGLKQVADGWLGGSTKALEVSIAGTTDKITVSGFAVSGDVSGAYNPVQQFRFADGTVWNLAAIRSKVSDGTPATGNVSGTAGNDSLTGGLGNDTLNGLEGNDTLDGSAGNDYLYGGPGADSLIGGSGNDTFFVDNIGDTTIESASGGTDAIESSITWSLGFETENLTLIGTGDINGTGNTVANTLLGNAGINRLDGAAGADTMTGGAGNDTYVVDNAGDTTVETAAGGADAVESSINWTLAAEVEKLTLTGTATINGTGNNLANTLIGNAGSNVLDGGTGNDSLSGGAGNDTYRVDSALDVITDNASEGTDTVQSSVTWTLGTNTENLTLTGSSTVNGTGNALANQLSGNSAANTLTGHAGNDRLDGAAGADAMTGGAGDDLYVVDNVGDTTMEVAAGGTDAVESSINWALAIEVEKLSLTGTAAISATGNALANTLIGNAAANRLSGGAGADAMTGGAGNDTYVVDSVGDKTTEVASGGSDAVESSISWALATEVEKLTLTGTAAINATGNAAANTLIGNAGINRLDGAAGADAMTGGAGNDTYVVDNAGDTTIEVASGGADTVESSISWTLASEVEKLTLTGTAAINATGNALANTLIGNAAANRLNGGAGIDSMTGGAGNDTYVIDAAGEVITEAASGGTDTVETSLTWTLAAETENLTLTGTANINGTGNAAANSLIGNAGVNRLDGSAGADVMTGGAGNDTYVVDNVGDKTTEVVSGGSDAVESSISWALATEVEKLTLAGTAAINATGNAVANILIGNIGANVLDGGLGNDTLSGGGGNDTYRVDSTLDVITDNASEGTDTVQSAVAWTLGTNTENLTLIGSSAIHGTGNALANQLVGNAAANALTGNAGDDSLTGGAGADSLTGGEGNDRYVGGTGSDTLSDASTTSNDIYVWGRGEGADTLTDLGGTDRLDILAGVTEGQIWLRHVGNNLELSVIGTSDSFTINGWYSNAANRVESFRLSDGQALLASQVQQLVDAMAAFAPPAAGQTTLPANYQTSLNPVIAPSWA